MPSSASRAPAPFALAPNAYAQFKLDEARMRDVLGQATASRPLSASGAERLAIPVPLPAGGVVELFLEETPIMESALAASFPSIRTYTVTPTPGSQVLSGKLDFTEQGFHALLSTPAGVVMIDPRTGGNGERSYISYYKHDYNPADKDRAGMVCDVPGHDHTDPLSHISMGTRLALAEVAGRSGTQLTTYRLALAATGEYTAFQGGTVPLALSAMVTTMNRVNSIYERDLAIRMTLIANTSNVIYTNGATDPYTNNDGSAMLDENKNNLSTVIGNANFDIGHVFSTGGGGVAGLGVVCGTYKAWGVTGNSAPIGDGFDVDYVAHEIGHQFGGNHTFNGTTGSCGGGNRNTNTAYEPGSGTSIMAYAGICGAEDLQPHSDALFHAGSIAEIIDYVSNGNGKTCGVRTSLSNVAPTIAALTSYTLPANTPFLLQGVASDADNDTLTYTWDEMDLGTQSTSGNMADDGTRPLFRSFNPDTSPQRAFPQWATLLANSSNLGERLPTTTRSLKFRLTVRDQKGGVNDSDVTLNVTSAAGPFVLTAPTSGQSMGTTGTITWNVANTASAPVNCSSVDISLSRDGGSTFPTVLLSAAPNNGSANVTFPAPSSSTARVKVQCSNNIFFDVSRANFSFIGTSITAPGAPVIGQATAGNTQATVSFSAPASNGGSAITGYTAISNPGNLASVGCTGSPCTVASLTNGTTYTFTVTATNGVGTSLPSSASNSVTPKGTQTISFGTAPSLVVGGNATVSATASSGLTVSFSSTTPGTCSVQGSSVSGLAVGTCTIAGNQAGNGSYSAAPQVTQTLTVSPAPTPSVTLTPSALTFNNQAVGTTSTAQPVTLSNTGNATLNISSISASDPIFGVSNACGATLAAGQSCNLGVSFSPSAVGTRLGSVAVASNAAGSPHSVLITAYGVVSNAPVCTLTATPPKVKPHGSTTLSANCSPAATSFSWTGGTCAGTTGSSCTATPTAKTSYSVTGSNNAGSSTAYVDVQVVTDMTPILMLLMD